MTAFFRTAVCAAALCLSLSAQAGLWVEVPSESPNFKKIEYRSDKLVQGESIVIRGGLQAPDTEGDCGQFSTVAVSEMRVVFTHTEPFTGFEGVSLRRDVQSDDLLDLYVSGPVPEGLGFLSPSDSCGDLTRPGANKCVHACYRSQEDVTTGANPIACSEGGARWIAVAMMVAFCRDSGRMPDGLAQSNFLMVKVKSKSSGSFNVPIDDVFRRTLFE